MPTLLEQSRKKTQRCGQCRRRFAMVDNAFRVTSQANGITRYSTRCHTCEAQGDTSGIYEATMRDLEAHHGPIGTWSIEVHREHTQRVYRALGWSEHARHASLIQTEPDEAITLPLDPAHPLFRPPAEALCATPG